MADDRETYEAIEQRRNDPEFMARLRHRIAQDKPILDRLAEYEAHDAYRTQAEETIARLHALVAHRTAERDALTAAVDRVRALHSQDTSLLAPGKWCPACGEETPCRTIRALAPPPGPAAPGGHGEGRA